MSIHKPQSYVEVYRLRSKSTDINELSGRTGRPDLTWFVSDQIAAKLALKVDDVLVDIGCGDGSLLKAAAAKGIDPLRGRLVGILPTEDEVDRLRISLTDAASQGIRIVQGLSHRTHLPDQFATKTVINGVLVILESETAVDDTLAEVRRITKPGGTVFVGETPDTDEFESRQYGDSIVWWLLWVLKERGLLAFLTCVKRTLAALVTKEPFIIAPKKTFWMQPDRFRAKLGRAGFEVSEYFRHREIDTQGNVGDSRTRWNYIAIRR